MVYSIFVAGKRGENNSPSHFQIGFIYTCAIGPCMSAIFLKKGGATALLEPSPPNFGSLVKRLAGKWRFRKRRKTQKQSIPDIKQALFSNQRRFVNHGISFTEKNLGKKPVIPESDCAIALIQSFGELGFDQISALRQLGLCLPHVS